MFVNVKRSLMFNFLFKINSERLSKRVYDNDNNVSLIISTFN